MSESVTVKSRSIDVDTEGYNDILDLTEKVAALVSSSGLQDGTVTVFVPGSTAGVTTLEFEPGLCRDLPESLEKIAPIGRAYHHDAAWGDGNGFSHVRAALVGPSLTVPFCRGELTLGRWQQIVLLDFDNKARRRKIALQIIGE